ncbi:MAG: hypothetical protein KDE27_27330, partial [Planctomycetes bacterium]|nr:hypothetical protein [Planctomycetota bacterium]
MESALRSSFFGLASIALAGGAVLAQCGNVWLPSKGYAGVAGDVDAICVWDLDGSGPAPALVVFGGTFAVAGTLQCANIVAYDPASGTWLPLGSGVAGSVRALAVLPNGDLVAGGSFVSAGGVAAERIARFDGTVWSPLGSGLTSSGPFVAGVDALVVLPNGDLVAGGTFRVAGSVAADYVARWNGSAWSALAQGLDGPVRALAAGANGEVVAGGEFLAAVGGPVAHRIASFGAAGWSPLGIGMDDGVDA